MNIQNLLKVSEYRVGPHSGRVGLVSLDTTHHTKVAYAVEMAYAWLERREQGASEALVLCGPNGTGKTHIALALWWLSQAGPELEIAWPGWFWLSHELMMALHASPMAAADIRRVTHNTKLLVIDEVGLEGQIPYSGKMAQTAYQSIMYQVVQYCYTSRVALVITTNLTLEGLRDHVGPACWSRLAAMAPRLDGGDSFIINMDGVGDYRLVHSGRVAQE